MTPWTLVSGLAQNEDIFMGDDREGDSVRAGAAGGKEGEVAGAVDEVVVADGGEQGDAAFDGFEAGAGGGGEDVAGQVDEVVALSADGSDGDGDDAAGAQYLTAG